MHLGRHLMNIYHAKTCAVKLHAKLTLMAMGSKITTWPIRNTTKGIRPPSYCQALILFDPNILFIHIYHQLRKLGFIYNCKVKSFRPINCALFVR